MLLPLAGLAAQEEESSFSILSFDIGYAPLFDFGGAAGNEYFTPMVFGFNIRVAGPLSIGFVSYRQGDTTPTVNLNLVKIKYNIIPQARAVVSFGYDSVGAVGNVTGVGIEGVPFQKKIGILVTEFKLGIDYFWVPAQATKDFDNGKLTFTLALGVGI
jgi:hypothetical protein